MPSALIGHTGFIGSNLARAHHFDAAFNSRNIAEIEGKHFGLVVCAGVRAEKWIANANPDGDKDGIARLLRSLDRVTAKRFVLISTVDVFPTPNGVDEDSPVPPNTQPYGRNRRWLEEECATRFDALVIRLAAMYGPGLKKNAIYDLVHDNELEKIDSRGAFQFYDVQRLWRDITAGLEHRLHLLHLPTEAVTIAEVARAAFGREFTNVVAKVPARYDIRTKHAALVGGRGGYVETREQVLDGLRRYVAEERAKAGS